MTERGKKVLTQASTWRTGAILSGRPKSERRRRLLWWKEDIRFKVDLTRPGTPRGDVRYLREAAD
jgi:hypothetical protein